jgi:hypothetical protein
MTDMAKSLFNPFDRGKLSRRQLVNGLAIAMALRPMAAFAQGVCGPGKAGRRHAGM